MTGVPGPQPRIPRDPTDEELVAHVVAGDTAAFALLYDWYARPVYTLAAHALGPAEAEDVVQEAFLRLWRRAAQFDPHRGPVAPWFLAIARHEVRARLRRRTREQRLAIAADIDRILAAIPDPTSAIEDQVWQRERGERVLRALQTLPSEQRRVLVFAYFGEVSHATMAATLGWPLGTVKKRLRLGLQKLRQALAPGDAPMGDDSAGPDGPGPLAPTAARDRIEVDHGP
jgi:RNA polymerase sigma-70 factor (ECF subfamily)